MSRNLIALVLASCATHAMAQLEGDTIVCSGNTYTYTADIPNATAYDWSFPSAWYDASGLGTSSVTITCNVMSGEICVTGVDDVGNVVGQDCLITEFGGGGSGLDLVPSTSSGCGSAEVSFSMVPNGTGGGCAPCGGTPHPNIAYALYDNDYFPLAQFIGFIDGGPITVFPPGFTFTVFQVDHTAGMEYPDAIVIEGGCGGSANASTNVTVQPIMYPVFTQDPDPVCIGEVVAVQELYSQAPGGGSWSNFVDLDVISPFNPMSAIVTGPNASAEYSGIDAGGCPMEVAGFGIHYCLPTEVPMVLAAPTLRSVGDHRYVISGAANGLVKVMTASGQEVLRSNTNGTDLSVLAPGIYVIQAAIDDGSTLRWKVMR